MKLEGVLVVCLLTHPQKQKKGGYMPPFSLFMAES